jgi:stage V sporulation protein G
MKNALAQDTLMISQVQVFPVQSQGKLKAFARILLNDQLLLTSLRIYEGTKGLFVSYPNDPSHKGEDYRQLFYPVTKDLRDHIEETILEEWSRLQSSQNPHI